jgi:uncharacterized membrane protein YfcA
MDWALVPLFVALGLVVGFLAGLLGIGGGMTMVPVLTMVFAAQRFPPDHLVHMAVATSTATIVFTALSSIRAHHARGAIRWPIVAAIAPGIVLGSLAGPQFAALLPTAVLATVFGAFTWFSAWQMVVDRKPAPHREMPGAVATSAVGVGIGFVSALVGAGGGFLSVPFMTWCNVKIHNAVATSAAIGLPIALAGTIGYVVAGLRQDGMPPLAVGYIYVPALACIVVASVLTAPLGARTAHSWPVGKLKKAFAALLFLLGAYMFWKAWSVR